MDMKKQILIIEDEPTYQIILTQALALKYDLNFAQTIASAKKKLETEVPELIILEFYLPDGNAFEMLKVLRDSEKTKMIPIILIAQESAIDIKVRAFSEGIYDFVGKPFNTAELMARIESHIARAEVIQSTNQIVRQFGDLVLDLAAPRISLKTDGKMSDLNFSPIEFKILHFLMNHGEKVRSREQMAHAIWNRKHFRSRTIDRHISSIRKKLGPCSRYLQTVNQGGYRLSAAESGADL